MFQDFFHELLASCTTSNLLPVTHLLLKTLYCPSLFLRSSKDASAFVKVPVDKLVFVEIVAPGLCH